MNFKAQSYEEWSWQNRRRVVFIIFSSILALFLSIGGSIVNAATFNAATFSDHWRVIKGTYNGQSYKIYQKKGGSQRKVVGFPGRYGTLTEKEVHEGYYDMAYDLERNGWKLALVSTPYFSSGRNSVRQASQFMLNLMVDKGYKTGWLRNGRDWVLGNSMGADVVLSMLGHNQKAPDGTRLADRIRGLIFLAGPVDDVCQTDTYVPGSVVALMSSVNLQCIDTLPFGKTYSTYWAEWMHKFTDKSRLRIALGKLDHKLGKPMTGLVNDTVIKKLTDGTRTYNDFVNTGKAHTFRHQGHLLSTAPNVIKYIIP